MFHELIKEDVNDPQNGWYKCLEQKEKDGYSAIIHSKAVPGKTINVVRSQSVTKGVKYDTFYKIITNFEKYQKRYDVQNSQVDFKMIEDAKTEDGVTTF